MSQTKQVIAARREQAKGKVVDEHILKNSNDEAWESHLLTAKDEEKKERKPREVKVKHAKGSPHEILHTLVDSLTSTEADHVLRHTKKHYKGVDVSGLDEESLDLAAINGIKGKLA